jgi:hypothetical protein
MATYETAYLVDLRGESRRFSAFSGGKMRQTLNFQRFGNEWKVVIDLATVQEMMRR